ncbi:MAG: hypothetical protein RLZZ526_28 [Actinomycetota bacterium]
MTVTPVISGAGEAAAILRAGGIVGLPTETVYGLAAVATDSSAVARVFSAKGRPNDHPLIVHVDSPEMASRYGDMNETATKLASAVWPGPLTLLLERTPLVGDDITGGRDTVAVRMPRHHAALAVIGLCGEGLVAPSANRFGHVSPTTVRHVLDDLDGLIDAVLDGGTCEVGIESTIVDCTGVLQVLRPGAVTVADIEACTGRPVMDTRGPSRAPGMLASHYAPEARVHLVRSVDDALGLEAELVADGSTVVLLGRGLGITEYAATLYEMMRHADDSGARHIIALEPTGEGLEAAVRDRLRKAAADTAR